MTKTLLEKMFFKPDYSVALLNVPKDLEKELLVIENTETSLDHSYDFILAFYNKEQQVKEDSKQLKKALLPKGLLWIAYPKNKALETDLNRDSLHALMGEQGFDGVSLVSLNDTWSAMRFKVI